MKGVLAILFIFLTCFTSVSNINAQQNFHEKFNILHINSYAITYPWTDSLIYGFQDVFNNRKDVHVFMEFLDAKRFGKYQFENVYKLLREKYEDIKFDVIITSDNDALDFMMQFGDELAPGIPVVFCGINNPQDYSFDNSRYYGIIDGVDLKAIINLIVKTIPNVKKLYFITDESTTSVVNMHYAMKLENEYSPYLQFIYLHNYNHDSLLNVVSKFEPGNAIALINYFNDKNGVAINPEEICIEIASKSPVPIFMDSESLMGKGIAGGIINNGRILGIETAELALKFVDDPNYLPQFKVSLSGGKYYFDKKILDKYNINEKNLPPGSIVINKHQRKPIDRHLEVIIIMAAGFLLTLLILYLSSKRRRKAEQIVLQKYQEIQEKNIALEEAHNKLNIMNLKLEGVNNDLSKTNEALSIAKKKSEESDKLKSAFLANISHEIRTPLNAIIGFAALLSDSELSEEERLEYFKVIGTSSDHLLKLIDDILDLSRLETGQLTISIEDFSVNELFEELIKFYSEIKKTDEVEIRMSEDILKDLLVIKSDRVRFAQIISNLLSNAVKFTKKGTIELGYSLEIPKKVIFYVKDTGIGIEQNNLKNIFNRFWKENLKGDSLTYSAGIGLAICKKMSETLGGKIWVESEKNIGTTFYISFQDYIISDRKLIRDNSINTDRIINNNGFTIAIVDDEKDNIYLLEKIIRNLNLKVLSFSSGTEIVEYFREKGGNKINIILMDIKMAEMDGITATEIIKSMRSDITIIAQTAYSLIRDYDKKTLEKFDDYIIKPIRPQVLLEKISKFLPADTLK